MRMLTIKMSDKEHAALRVLAEAMETSMADVVRQGLGLVVAKRGVERVEDEKPRRQHVRFVEAPTMERLGIARTPVSGHRHSAAKVIAGGIGVCECGARRTTGSDWQLPRV